MTALEDAVKAAAEAGQGVSHDFLVECGLTDNEADAAINAVAEDAVAAAAPILLAAERARIAEPCLCAGHYMACDEPCPDFWLPDVPMSPDKGHAETAPEEGQ